MSDDKPIEAELPPFVKGGRGVKAPYKAISIRVPEPLYDDVTELCRKYKVAIAQGRKPTNLEDLLASEAPIYKVSETPSNEETIISLARELLAKKKSRKSTKETLDNLLKVILGDEVNSS